MANTLAYDQLLVAVQGIYNRTQRSIVLITPEEDFEWFFKTWIQRIKCRKKVKHLLVIGRTAEKKKMIQPEVMRTIRKIPNLKIIIAEESLHYYVISDSESLILPNGPAGYIKHQAGIYSKTGLSEYRDFIKRLCRYPVYFQNKSKNEKSILGILGLRNSIRNVQNDLSQHYDFKT